MNKHKRFDQVWLAGEWEPEFWASERSLRDVCDRYARQAKAFGLTAIQVNFIPDPYHPLLFHYPGEVYLYFGNYAAALDMFADSTYSRGIYPRFMLEANLRRLVELARAAERHGLDGMLYVGEPRFVHPELFARHPNWRGPRVDNPAVSMNPLYALDTDRDDVMDHYRQMLRPIMRAAPNIRNLIIFCHDSGAGFSHSYALYAGPNGPFYNSTFFHRETHFGRRVGRFCGLLREEALPFNPAFEVAMTSQFTPEERAEIQREAPDGVHVLIWGRESRSGGLEDQYAWYQCGVKKLKAIGFDGARQARWAEFEERVDIARQAGRPPRIVTSAPNEHYSIFPYIPNAREFLQILKQAESWGGDAVLLKGPLTYDDTQPFNINQRAVGLFLADRRLTPEQALHNAVASMVAPAGVESMLKALDAVEEAVRFRPLYNLYLPKDVTFLPGPLVPDPSRLTLAEKAYYWMDAHDTTARIKGEFYYIPAASAGELMYFFEQLEASTFPAIRRALRLLTLAVAQTRGDRRSQECLAYHRRVIELHRCLMASMRHYAMMSAHWRRVRGVRVPKPEAIVDAEIRNNRAWLRLLGGEANRFIRLAPFDGTVNSQGASFGAHLRLRLARMQAHRNDKARCFDIEHDRLALC